MNTINQTWSFLDNLYYTCTRLEYVNQRENIFRVRLMKYRGESLQLSDGTTFQHADLLIKIHLHNCLLMRELQEIEGEIRRALFVYNRVEESLPGLAKFLIEHPLKDEIKGILGITLLHRGIKRLGFDAIDIPNPLYEKFKQLYLAPMFLLMHSGQPMVQKAKLKPKFLVMSADRLFQSYMKG